MRMIKALQRWSKRAAPELDAAALALVADAQAAERLRTHQRDANVAALTIERTRDRLDRFGWGFLFAGLAYTTVNVQEFVAKDTPVWELRWLTAWLVEPMVMGLMLVLLRGEQIANRYGEQSGRWVRITRWAALAITYVMNTGTYWTRGDIREVFVHSVPVVLVFLAAEALVQQRLTLTTVVDQLETRIVPSRLDSSTFVTTRPPSSAFVPDRPAPSQDGPERPTEPLPVADDLSVPRTLKERAWEAFKAIADEGKPVAEIGPAEVDRRAGVRVGTSKVSGRMEEFRSRYLPMQTLEVSDGDADAAAG
jgi:hypothetical protein